MAINMIMLIPITALVMGNALIYWFMCSIMITNTSYGTYGIRKEKRNICDGFGTTSPGSWERYVSSL